jgi:prevent-host-death family protein
MENTIGSFEAKTHWSGLLSQVITLGQEVTITKHGKPVAKLVPYCEENVAQEAAKKLRELRKKTTLGGISWKELRDEGRK